MAINLRQLLLDRAARGIGTGGGLLNTQATGGLLGNLNPLLLGASIIGSGMQGRDPFSSVLPAATQAAQLQQLLTPEEKERNIIKDVEGRQRYADTGELVFPDVKTPTKEPKDRRIIKDIQGRQRYEDKMWKRLTEKYETIRKKSDVIKSGYMFPIKVKDKNRIIMENDIIETTHVPTGCMLIKRHVITKMIEKHPELEIFQPTVINGKEEKKPNFFNLFDTLHDPDTKRYYGEDFGFCQRWRDMGGQVFAYVMDYITHVGEHQYCGRFYDELASLKRIDVDEKIK